MPRTLTSPVFHVVVIALCAGCTYDVGEDIYGPVAHVRARNACLTSKTSFP